MKTRGSHTPFPTEAPENGRGQSLTVPALRTTVLLAVMFALQVLCRAQSIEFTSDCVSEADRELLTDVHEFLFDHRSEIWEEIARNPDGLYADVDDKFRDRWMEEIEHVKIKCGYDSINVCGNHPDRGGRCGFWADNDFNPFGDEFSDKILICLDNLSDYSQSTGVPLFALLCETMAHEVMHQGDGWGLGFHHEIAYTVGEAAQCVAVSPDLDPEIVSVTTAPDSASTNLDVEITVHVRDENPYSSAEALTTLVKGGEYVNRNGYSTLELYVDGDRVGAKSIPGVDPSGPGTYIFTIELDPSYSDGSFEIKVLADKDEDLWELDENNNTYMKILYIGVDLATTVEIAGPYSTLLGYRQLSTGKKVSQYYRRLTYNVFVENLSATNTSVSTDCLLYYRDMWAGLSSSLKEKTIAQIPPLGPAESYELTVKVDVPISMTGEIQATIPVYFIADGNEADNCDLDWSNNTVYIQIDKDYFRPDYRVEITYAYLNTSEDLAHLTCKVRNLGPEPATCPSRTTFMLNGSPAGAARVSALGAAKSIDLSFETRCVMLFGAEIKYDFLVVADQMDAIDENDEYNNTDAVTITYGHNFKEMMNFWELYPDRDSIVQTIDLGDICQVMFLDAEALMAKYGDPLNGLLRDWLDAAGSGPTFPTAYYDASTNIVVLQNYALSRNVTVVIR